MSDHSDEPRDELYFLELLEVLATRLKAKRAGKGFYTGLCPRCKSAHSLAMTTRGYSCRSELCGWKGSLEQLRTELYVENPAPGAGDGGRVIPAPTEPMRVARELVADLYTKAVGLTLHDHCGDFYRYNGTC